MSAVVSHRDDTRPATQSGSILRSAGGRLLGDASTIGTIAIWEILGHFRRPAAYVMLLAATLVAGWHFSLLMTLLAQGRVVPLRQADDPLSQFLGPNVFLVFSLMLIVPVVTMGMVADERRRGIWEMLLTSPVQPWQVLTGKFAAAWVAVVVNVLPWICCLLALRYWPGIGLEFDRGYVIGGVIGIATISLSLCAVGMVCTTLCKAPFAASVATVSAMIGLLLLSIVPRAMLHWHIGEAWMSVAERFACWEHLARFSTGAIDPSVICGHVSFAVLLLWIACQATRGHD
ncbi:ABC-2 family transporter protein [Symmachiella macrocystis]|uniref:ABC-2 family transporter protein n=1 Tax=Symmachiella macrocystis TaxID=2527985 RepID=A0A5C6B2W9_9PLAN|nr:ABC transporter permease [Symmachiella macrocystis]TWU06665.1 ABC-2 family transporter protein [Symmachiella macrocystis]